MIDNRILVRGTKLSMQMWLTSSIRSVRYSSSCQVAKRGKAFIVFIALIKTHGTLLINSWILMKLNLVWFSPETRYILQPPICACAILSYALLFTSLCNNFHPNLSTRSFCRILLGLEGEKPYIFAELSNSLYYCEILLAL